MKLSFEDRIEWDEAKGATIPQLTDAEIDEVLREYRPTAENRCCECGGTRVCPLRREGPQPRLHDGEGRGDLRWRERVCPKTQSVR
jgi:hypothetical protein